MKWQAAAITRIVRRSPTVKSFFFELPEPFAFTAGQHVDVRLTAPDGYRAQRSYSIASAPESGDGLELAIERLDDGEVSPFFHDIAEIGDEIDLRGPIGGHFIWKAEEGGPLLLIAGGAGVVPFVSFLRHRAARSSTAPMLLLFSARTFGDILFRDELRVLHDRRDGFELAVTLTRERASPEGFLTRRIDNDMIAEMLSRLPGQPRQAYVCGSNPFVAVAADGAIAAGVPPEKIRTERYGV